MKENYRDQLFKVSGELDDLDVMLEKIAVLLNNLDQNYFADSKEVHEANNALFLLHDYDEARNFVGMAHDYAYEAKELVKQINDAIDLKSEE